MAGPEPPLSLTPMPFVVAGLFAALIVLVFGLIMPARTIRGARTLEKVLGFLEFLRRVEGDRFSGRQDAGDVREFLPFAMAFGVEKKWAKAFQNMLQPPRWYSGTNPAASTPTFSSRLATMTTKAAPR